MRFLLTLLLWHFFRPCDSILPKTFNFSSIFLMSTGKSTSTSSLRGSTTSGSNSTTWTNVSSSSKTRSRTHQRNPTFFQFYSISFVYEMTFIFGKHILTFYHNQNEAFSKQGSSINDVTLSGGHVVRCIAHRFPHTRRNRLRVSSSSVTQQSKGPFK